MATKSIGATGRDYATFALHAAYVDALNALAAPEIGEAYNDAEFSVAGNIATYTGFTADATNKLTIRPATGQGFKDHASAATNPLKYDQAKGVGLKCTDAYSQAVTIEVNHTTLSGLQILHTAANNRQCIRNRTDSAFSGIALENAILEKAASTTDFIAEWIAGTIRNSLLVQRGTGIGLSLNYPTSGVTLHNVTIVRPSDISAAASGVEHKGGSGTTTMINCAVFGFTNIVNTAARFTGSNNASNVAIGFGSANQASLTYTSQFEDTTDAAGFDFRAKSGGALLDNGTNTGTPATDIIGQAISNTTRDIGAWEFQAGGGPAGFANPLPLLGVGRAA